MPNERFIDAGVGALWATIDAYLVTALRAVELDQGLPVGTIPDPVEILPFEMENRTIAPSVQIYETVGEFDHAIARQRNRYITVNAEITVLFNYGVLGQEAANLRRYITAILEIIEEHNTLGGAVTKTLVNDIGVGKLKGPTENDMRRACVIQVAMDVHSIRGPLVANGEMYITTPNFTGFATLLDYYENASLYTLGDNIEFDQPVAGRLRYTGQRTKKFLVSVDFSVDPQVSPMTFRMALFQDGTLVAKTVQEMAILNTETKNISLRGVLDFLTNSYVDVRFARIDNSGSSVRAFTGTVSAIEAL